MVLFHRGVHGAQFRPSLFEGGSGSEARKELGHAMYTQRDHSGREMMGAGYHVGDDFGVLRIGNAGLKDADDRGGGIATTAQANGLADHRRIFPEGVRPESIGENNDPGGLGTVILGPDEAPEHGMKAHHVEVRSTDYPGTKLAGLAEPEHGEANGGEVAEVTEALYARPQVLNFRHRPRAVFGADAGRALPDIYQPVLVTVDQWLEEHAAHQRENGGVGADAQRERHDHCDGQPFRAPERVGGNSQITKK